MSQEKEKVDVSLKVHVKKVELPELKKIKKALKNDDYNEVENILDDLSYDYANAYEKNGAVINEIVQFCVAQKNLELLELLKHPFCCENNHQDLSEIVPIVAEKISALQAYDFIMPCIDAGFTNVDQLNYAVVEHSNASLCAYIMNHKTLKLNREHLNDSLGILFYDTKGLEVVKLLEPMLTFNLDSVADCLKSALYNHHQEGIEYLLQKHTKNTLVLMKSCLNSMQKNVHNFELNPENLIFQINYDNHKMPQTLLFLWHTWVEKFDINTDNQAVKFFIQPFLYHKPPKVQEMYDFLTTLYDNKSPPQFVLDTMKNWSEDTLIEYEKLRFEAGVDEKEVSKTKLKL